MKHKGTQQKRKRQRSYKTDKTSKNIAILNPFLSANIERTEGRNR